MIYCLVAAFLSFWWNLLFKNKIRVSKAGAYARKIVDITRDK